MAQYKVEDIVGDVRLVLDQNQTSEAMSGFGDIDTSDLDDVIRSKIEDAAQLIVSSAPIHKLDGGKDMNLKYIQNSKVRSSDYTWYVVIPLPADYLRLLYVKCDDWNKAVSEGITTEDPQYALQRSRVESVRGNAERPVVVLAPLTMTIEDKAFQGNGKCLECYSTTQPSKKPSVKYIAKPAIYKVVIGDDTTEEIDIPTELYRSVVYATGYLTATAFGSETQATMLISVAKDLADINEKIQAPVIPQQVEQQQEEQ